MKTEVNSIRVPEEWIDLCEAWHGGMSSMFYAVASTGGLTTGSIRPVDDDGQPLTDEQWYHGLFWELSCEAGQCARKWAGPDHEDYHDLCDLEQWAEGVAERLAAEYGID